jgi:N-acyl-D-aspartate/D-glutamate deacylase
MLGIEDAVRKITSEPAKRIGLSDRGVIAKGQKADILIFEPNELDNLPTFEDPKRFPSGIHRLWINGKLYPKYGSPQRGSGHVLRKESDRNLK